LDVGRRIEKIIKRGCVLTNAYSELVTFWRKNGIRTVAELERRLGSFRVIFAYNSGRIENPEIKYSDTREIFENGRVLNFSGDPRTIFELRNQRVCYDFLKEKIIAALPLSVDLVLAVHRVLTEGTYDERRYIENGERPGEFKKHDYVAGILEVGSPASDVPGEISELIGEINGYAGCDVLKAGAYFHARFEYIHPFADGNGRVGRTLLNYWLMIRNCPPLIVYDDDKEMYYECLLRYDNGEEIEPLYAFFVYQAVKTWEKTLGKQGVGAE
jgi:Fic family protein